MSHRALFFVLTCVATWGIGSAAIAARQGLPSATPPLLAQSGESPEPLSPSLESPAQPQASPATQNLQSRLAELGYYDGPIDGVYGPSTRNALAAFQKSVGLVGTGILDPLTQERLNNPTAAPAADSPASEDGEGAPSAASESGQSSEGLPTPQDSSSPLESPTPEGAQPSAAEGSTPEQPTPPPPGDSANPETESNAAPGAENAPPPAEESNNSGFLPLALMGALIVVIGGLGGAALLFLARRHPPVEDSAEAETDSLEYSLSEPGTAPVPLASVPQNGSSQLPGTSVESGKVSLQASPLPVQAAASPKLAKVNIIDELIQELDNPDPGIRRKAIWELGQRGNSAAVHPLVGLMMTADSHEQSLILAALAEISTRTLKPMNRALALSLQDENPEVRKNAIRDMTRIYDLMGQVGRMLGHATNDGDPEVRKTAHWALDQLNHIRLAASESAALLQEGSLSTESLPGDDPSSHPQ